MNTREQLLQIFIEIAKTKPIQSCGGGSCGRKYSIPTDKINKVLIDNGIEVPKHNIMLPIVMKPSVRIVDKIFKGK
jgi:hypothetical protein